LLELAVRPDTALFVTAQPAPQTLVDYLNSDMQVDRRKVPLTAEEMKTVRGHLEAKVNRVVIDDFNIEMSAWTAWSAAKVSVHSIRWRC
jgi:hypothetical protein